MVMHKLKHLGVAVLSASMLAGSALAAGNGGVPPVPTATAEVTGSSQKTGFNENPDARISQEIRTVAPGSGAAALGLADAEVPVEGDSQKVEFEPNRDVETTDPDMQRHARGRDMVSGESLKASDGAIN